MRFSKVFGHVFFIVLLIVSYIFTHERMLYTDPAEYLFQIANTEWFNVTTDRYVEFIPQIPTVILAKMGMPLRVLEYSYSLSFPLMYYLIFLLIVYRFKNSVAAFTLIFGICLGVHDSFTNPANGVQQAMGWACLLYGYLHSKSMTWPPFVRILFQSILVALSYYSHPMGLFVIAFVIAFYAVQNNNYKTLVPYFLLAVLVVLNVIKLIKGIGGYEAQQMSQMSHFNELLPNFFNLYSWKFFWMRSLGIYLWPILMFCSATVLLAIKRDWLKLLLLLAGAGGFMLITVINFSLGDSDMMMERCFMPFISMSVLVMFQSIDIYMFDSFLIKSLCCLAAFMGLCFMVNGGNFYTQRTAYLRELIAKAQKQGGQKFFVPESKVKGEILLVRWATASETLMLSKMDHGRQVTIYPMYGNEDLSRALTDSNSFLSTIFRPYMDADKLNPRYFNLSPGTYQQLKLD